MGTRAVTDQNFQSEVLQADKPVLVDFWAEWCGPCRMIAPALEEIAGDIGDKVDIVKLNIDEKPQTPTQYGVRGIPTMVLFKGGQPVFYDENGYAGLSKTALSYIAGLLYHAPALLAITNPSTNSYRRLVPGFEAPVNAFFSLGNRSAAIRIPNCCSWN